MSVATAHRAPIQKRSVASGLILLLIGLSIFFLFGIGVEST
jgi:hypothetical protein